MADLARRNSEDPEFESPYTREALEEGLDIPIWEKLMTASFKVHAARPCAPLTLPPSRKAS